MPCQLPTPRRALLGLALAAGCQAAPRTADLAIEHATVIDVRDGSLAADRTILIAGGRITAVAPSSGVRIADGVPTVDATDRFVIPGLWDSHVHSATSIGWHFPLFLAHGVTSVRNMHSTVDTALGLTTAIQRRLASGDLLGPRFLANGPIIDGPPPTWPGTVLARNPDEGRAAVDSLTDGGADFIKVYDALDLPTYRAIAAEAKSRGIPMDGHVPMRVPAESAAAAGQRVTEHLSGITMSCSNRADSIRAEYSAFLGRMPTLPYPMSMIGFFSLVRAASDTRDPAACARVVAAYHDHGVTVDPTFVTFVAGNDPGAVLGDSARMAMVPPAVVGMWRQMAASELTRTMRNLMGPVVDNAFENLRMLHDAGVPVLAGTDLGNPFLVPGASLHDELELLVRAGLSNLEALQAATIAPARTFGLADSLGVVAKGTLADLVLLDRNPLDDIANTRTVRSVVLRGRLLDRAELDRLIDRARHAEN